MQCTTKLSGVRTAIPTEQAPWCGRAAAICAVLKEPMAQKSITCGHSTAQLSWFRSFLFHHPALEERRGGRVGIPPALVQQEIVDLAGEDQLLDGHALLA